MFIQTGNIKLNRLFDRLFGKDVVVYFKDSNYEKESPFIWNHISSIIYTYVIFNI